MKIGKLSAEDKRQTLRIRESCCIAFVAVLILCSFGVIKKIKYLEHCTQTVQLVIEPGISVMDARQMVEESAELETEYEFVFWGQSVKESVSDPCLAGNRTETNVILICGNSDLIFPEAGYMGLQDTASCLISSETAYALFGSCDVEGLEVVCGENTYRILDVIDLDQKLLVCQAEKTETSLLNRVSVVTGSEKSPAYLAEKFESRWCEGEYIDLELVLFLLKGLICAVYAVLLGGLILGIKKRKGIIFSACRLCSIVCCVVMILKNIFVPRDYLTDIASKIFWKELVESKICNFELFLMISKSVTDLSFIKEGLGIILLVIAVCGAAYMQRSVEK